MRSAAPPQVAVLYGDAWDLAGTLEPESIDCIVTSPPYWKLRDYGHEGQFGVEATPEEYVARLVELFARLRPALKSSGTVWLNLGDCYADDGGPGTGGNFARERRAYQQRNSFRVGAPGHLKPKDLVGIPWRVALALQADDWWLRRDIIWSKLNPMPESVTDRPTTSHEYVFLLTKSERYFFDRDAVREPAVGDNAHDLTGPGYAAPGQSHQNGNRQRKVPRGWDTGPGDHKGRRGRYAPSDDYEPPEMRPGRNVRSVWSFPTQPYAGAHFATMPQAIAERCIKAGCPGGGTVLDPFAGSGTTIYVARKLGRHSVGFELNEEYRPLIEERLKQGVLL